MPTQATTTLELDGRKLMHRLAVHVRIKHLNEMRVRAWIGGQLLRLGSWIAGCELAFIEIGMPMKIDLVFDDWRKKGKSVYLTEAGVELSMGLFHGGTTFNGSIYLDEGDAQELQRALDDGYQAVFWIGALK